MSLTTSNIAEIFAKDYLLAANSLPDILRRLERTYSVLKNIEQDDHEKLPSGIDNIAHQIVHEKFMKNKSKVS